MAKRKKPLRRRILKAVFISFLILFAVLAASVAAVAVYASVTVDRAEDEALFQNAKGGSVTMLYYDANKGADWQTDATYGDGACVGVVGYDAVEWEEERLVGGETCLWTPLDEISSYLQNAIVAIEDHRFYEHNGVDILRTAKAMANYLFRFEGSFGGSTITQQLIKNISGDREKSAGRKIREIARALAIEESHEKNEILELYLNILPLSDGCIGVGAAAEHYFGKSPSELSLSEAASLAAITNSPASYNPIYHPERHTARRDLVLSKMHEHGMITEAEYADAVALPLQLDVRDMRPNKVSSWYVETVVEDVIADLMEKKNMTRESASRALYGGGLKIYTCMDKEVQGVLEEYFSDASHFDAGYAYSMTVVDPESGDLLGVVGNSGKKTANRALNYATVRRAPGSALKPLSVYAPALEEGLITWNKVYDDVPVLFRDKGSYFRPWPYNSDYIYSGLTTVAEAVAESKNTVAVRILEELSAETSYHYLTQKFGVSGVVRKGTNLAGESVTDLALAPLALGQLTYGVSLRELTAAYTAFADGGVRHAARSYAVVFDKNGNLLLSNEAVSARVVSEGNAAIMTKMLEGVVEEGTAECLTLRESVATAGKTGTTTSGKDRLFVGYTPYLCAGIYAGYTGDGTPSMKFKGHLTVWDEVMKLLHKPFLRRQEALREFTLPDNVVKAEYCRDSGQGFSDTCALDVRGGRLAEGYFIRGTEPKGECERHVSVLYDTLHGGVASDACILNGNADNLRPIALVRVDDRDFPTEVIVSDAQYVYRDMTSPPTEKDEAKPFFYVSIPEGRFVGISVGVGKPQFNRFCYFHYEGNYDDFEDAPLEEESSDIPYALEGDGQAPKREHAALPPEREKDGESPSEKRKKIFDRFFPF